MKILKTIIKVIIGIILFPILLLLFIIFCIIPNKKDKKKEIENRQSFENTMKANSEKRFSIPYIEPKKPVSDDEFMARIQEFTCIQFWSCNDYSGYVTMKELIASEHKDEKERILSFLQEHPISELLHGDCYAQMLDADRWRLRFIFEDESLNRCILGYGTNQVTAPFKRYMIPHIPEILSLKEKAARESLMREIQDIIDIQNS